MAAPSGIVWGSTVGDYGRIGIYKSLSSTNTTTTVTVEVWYWSKYSTEDVVNTFYFDNLASSGSATTSRGAVSIHTTSNSGGWSTTNQVKIASYSYSYTRGTSAVTRYLYAKLTTVEAVDGTMYASTTFSVPKLATYTVSYNANGGSGAPSSQTKYYGKSLTLSSTVPTRTGYTFQGWGTSASDTSVDYAAGGSYTSNASITLYAIWQAGTYTVSYNANGGSGAPSSQTKTYGVNLTLSSTQPTREGYIFKGWATSSGGSVAYSSGGSYTNNASVTLYAVWQIITYTVSYNANGGSNAPSSQTKNHGSTLTLTSAQPTRTGHTFKGWATSSGGSVAYSSGGSYTNNASITLYAVWQAITYTVSYNANGGSGAPDSQTKTYGVNLTLSSTKPTRQNYNFKGWATSSGGGVVYAAGGSYTANASVTLYAVWEVAYTKPRITDITISRCTSGGTTDDAGAYAKVSFKWASDKTATGIVIRWKESKSTAYSNSVSITASGTSGSVTNKVIGNNSLSIESSYDVLIEVVDSSGYSQVTRQVHGYKFPFDMKEGGTGTSVGIPATLDGVFDVGFVLYPRSGFMNVGLPAGTNLNDIRVVNTYYGDFSVGSYSNAPITSGSFVLEVLSAGFSGQRIQRLTQCAKTSQVIYQRACYSDSDTWGSWMTI